MPEHHPIVPDEDSVEMPTREGYDLWSSIYDEDDNPLMLLEAPEVRRQMGEVRRLKVADIGCGTGRHTLAFAAAGAAVTAVDFSEGMLAKARAKPGADGVRFIRHDLETPLPFDARSFDRVACCLVTDHIADLDGLFNELGRICQDDGFVLVSAFHPAMLLQGCSARFTDPATGRVTWVASRPHQVCDYVMAAVRAGLLIDHMSEHVVDAALVTRSPKAAKYIGWPLLMMLRLRPAAR